MIRTSVVALALTCLVACGRETVPPQPATAPAPATAAPRPPDAKAAPPAAGPTLAETPDAKLGTSPAGFGLAVGQPAPDATLDDVTGKRQKLSDLYKTGPTFVVFYRGGWCPFCNIQLHDYAAAKPELDKRGIQLVAISVDKPSEEAKTQAKNGVAFPMLSDSKLTVHKAFKVVHVTTEEEQKKLAGFGLDLSAYSGELHRSHAVPAVFLVDKGGVIRFAHVDEDYKTRPSAKQLLGIADKLAAK